MATTERTGSCECGAIKFTIAPTDEKAIMCHCASCQKQSASAFGSVIVVPTEAVSVVSGQPKQWLRVADSGNEVLANFCETCGTRVWHGDIEKDAMLKVRAGSLDDPIDFSKAIQIWTSRKAPGITLPDGVPHFAHHP